MEIQEGKNTKREVEGSVIKPNRVSDTGESRKRHPQQGTGGDAGMPA